MQTKEWANRHGDVAVICLLLWGRVDEVGVGHVTLVSKPNTSKSPLHWK